MTTSEQINEIAGALSKAQGAMQPAIKDASNPAFKSGNRVSKYADLAANVEAARGPLAANGLAVVQEATTTERGIAVATRIVHASGQWMQFDPFTVPLSKQDAHGVGSALTYARRYALGAALGLVAEDDDGNAAAQVNGATTATPAAPEAPVGYDEWLLNMVAVADNGWAEFKEAFNKSPVAYRQHLTRNNNAQWEKLKKRSAEVDAKAKQPVGA